LDTRRYDIDYARDTVTRPAAACVPPCRSGSWRRLYGATPLSNRLQALMAERFGFRECAVFLQRYAKQCMAALLAHCRPRRQYLVGQEAHTYSYEQGGAAVLGTSSRSRWRMSGRWIVHRNARKAHQTPGHPFCSHAVLALEHPLVAACWPLAYQRQGHGVCPRAGAAHPSGRRANLQRHRETSDREQAARGGLRFGVVWPLQGSGRAAGSVVAGSGFDCAGATLAQGTGRRHAPGRRAGGGRTLCPGASCAVLGAKITRMQAVSPTDCAALGCTSNPANHIRTPHSGQKRRGLKSHLDERGILATSGLARVWSRIWMYRF